MYDIQTDTPAKKIQGSERTEVAIIAMKLVRVFSWNIHSRRVHTLKGEFFLSKSRSTDL